MLGLGSGSPSKPSTEHARFIPRPELIQGEEEIQLTIRRKMTDTLAIFTIRWDEKSVVHGKKVMKYFLNSCHNIEDPLRLGDNGTEVHERDSIYADWRGQSGTRLTQQRINDMRCLCFSY